MKKTFSVIMLTEGAVLIALATALSFVKIWQMPMGGSVTLLSMLPICLFAIKYGPRYSFYVSFLYGFLQLVLVPDGSVFAWGLSPTDTALCIALDYILAFGALGLAGIFRRKGIAGWSAGIAVALFGRFTFSFISGATIFGNWSDGNNAYVYSLLYNGTYMLPELIITLVAAGILFGFPIVRKQLMFSNETSEKTEKPENTEETITV